jgi:hypothetical protein
LKGEADTKTKRSPSIDIFIGDTLLIEYCLISGAFYRQSGALATILNTGNFCGRSDWATNQKVSLLGLDCAIGKVNRGDVIYDIFLIDKKSLFFSDQLGVIGFRSSLIRPEKLDTSHPYVKK